MKHVNLTEILGIVLIAMTLFSSIQCHRRNHDVLITLKERNEKLRRKINHLKHERKRSSILRKLNRSGRMRLDRGFNNKKKKTFRKRYKNRSHKKYRSKPQKSHRLKMGYIQNFTPVNQRNIKAEIFPKRKSNSYNPINQGQMSRQYMTPYQQNILNGVMNPMMQNQRYSVPTNMNQAIKSGQFSFNQSSMNNRSRVMGGTLNNMHLQVTPVMNTTVPNGQGQINDLHQSFQQNMQNVADNKMQNLILNERKNILYI